MNTKTRTSAEQIVVVHPALKADAVFEEISAQKIPAVKLTTGILDKLNSGMKPDPSFESKLKEQAFTNQDKVFITDYPYHDGESHTLCLIPVDSELSKWEATLKGQMKDPREASNVMSFLKEYNYRVEDTFISLEELIHEIQHRFGFKPEPEVSRTPELVKKQLEESGMAEAKKILKNEASGKKQKPTNAKSKLKDGEEVPPIFDTTQEEEGDSGE